MSPITGFPGTTFMRPSRSTGTLQCYSDHRVLPSPLEDVGESDITAHVEWTSLAERAEECGLHLGGFTDQHHFLTGLLSSSSRSRVRRCGEEPRPADVAPSGISRDEIPVPRR